jgi:hypothetical protein
MSVYVIYVRFYVIYVCSYLIYVRFSCSWPAVTTLISGFSPLKSLISSCRVSSSIMYPTSDTRCNFLVGSISQWKFITLKVQFTTLDYSSQLFQNSNTSAISTGSRAQLTNYTPKVNTLQLNSRQVYVLSVCVSEHNCSCQSVSSLYTVRHFHSNVSFYIVVLL